MNFSSLPVELIRAVVDQLESESDISSLSRVSCALRHIVLPLLYQHNVRHNDAFALIDAVVCSNTAAIINALHLGGATIDMTFSTRSDRFESSRLMAGKPESDQAQTDDGPWFSWASSYEFSERTPLAIAVLYNQPASAELLLTRYEAICPEESLNMAAHLGHTEIARMLLEKAHCSIPPPGGSGDNLMYYAIDGGDLGMIQMLLNHGLHVSQTNFTTMDRPMHARDLPRSLMRIEQTQFEALIRLLASHKTKLHEWISNEMHPAASFRRSLVGMAVYYGQVQKLQFLVRSELIIGLSASEAVVIEQFCAEHADLLHQTARRGHAEMVRYLLGHHASKLRLGQLDKNDVGIPLFNALTYSHVSAGPNMVRALVEVFPVRNGKSSDEIRHEMLRVQTAELHERLRLTMLLCFLQSAHRSSLLPRIECSQTLQVLIDAGADPFTVCARGRNALQYVLDGRCGDCAKVLLASMKSDAAVTIMKNLVDSAGGGSGMTWKEAHDATLKGQWNFPWLTSPWIRGELSSWHVEFLELVEAQRKFEQAGL